jgi:hypothetical protein
MIPEVLKSGYVLVVPDSRADSCESEEESEQGGNEGEHPAEEEDPS